jgi:hypothetical protein
MIDNDLLESLNPLSHNYDKIYNKYGLDKYDDNPNKIIMNALMQFSQFDE